MCTDSVVQVQEATQGLLCVDPMCDYMLLWTSPLLNVFGDSARYVGHFYLPNKQPFDPVV